MPFENPVAFKDDGPDFTIQFGPDIGSTTGTAGSILVGQTLTNTIDFIGDNDWFAVNLVAGQAYEFVMNGVTLSDPFLELRNSAGAYLKEDDDGGPGFNSLLPYLAPTTGTYYISAEAFDTATGTYNLTVRTATVTFEPSPDFASPALDSISWGDRWDHNNLTVYFGPFGYSADGITSEGFTTFERQQFIAAFDAISAVSNLTFTIVTTGASADIQLILDTNGEADGLFGYFNPPGTANDGVGVFNGQLWNRFAGGDLTVGGFGYYTIVHEVLHGMGLAHPHDTGGSSSIMPGVSAERDDFGSYNLNQGIFTMMSYNPGYHTGTPGSDPVNGTADDIGAVYGFAAGPMALDIGVLQGLYGANMSHNTGADTYTLPTGTGAGVYWSSIWDAGGVDTIRHTGAGAAQIDLRPANLEQFTGGGGFVSAVNGTRGGFTIANGVVIENAVGGSANDLINGNDANNNLSGFGGFDTIIGWDGNDTIDGGTGADSLYGGIGNDLLIGGVGFDQLFGGPGGDTLQGGDTNDYLYGEDGNDLILGGTNIGTSTELLDGGTGNDTLRGEGGFDLLRGGEGDDLLEGGNQADNLYGDAGNDTLNGDAGFDRLFGGDGDDMLDGGEGPDGHFGQAGNDTIIGGDGDDRVFGGSGNDLIQMGAGNDTIYADAGFDTIDGGAGNDLIFGRFNADTFIFAGAHGNDTIADFDEFSSAERIDLSGTIRDFVNISSIYANTLQVGANVVIDTGGGNSIQLNSVFLSDLTTDDFDF